MAQVSRDMKTPRTRGRPKLEDVGDIESELLGAALEEFIAHGYGGASMSRIVRAAKISKTTLYSRYTSKDDLFRAIMQRQMDALSQAATLTERAGRLELEAGLRAYGRRALELSFEGGLLQVNRLIFSEAHRFPELAAAAATRTAVGVRQIADFLRRCAAEDGLACRNPEVVAEVFIFMLRGWYVNTLLTGGTVSKAEQDRWVDQAVQVLIAGRADW